MKKAFLVLIVESLRRGATLEVPSQYGAIQEAIDASERGDEVPISFGEYEITIPVAFSGKAITVQNVSGPGDTMIRMYVSPDDPTPEELSCELFPVCEGQ